MKIATMLLFLGLCPLASAAPLVQPQDISRTIANSTFTFPGSISIGTTTNSTDLTVYGVITSSTPIPSISCNAGTGTLSPASTNLTGVITAGLAAANCTVTFSTAKAWPKAPVCLTGEGSSLVTVRVSAVSATAFTVTGTTISNDVIYYICMGTP